MASVTNSKDLLMLLLGARGHGGQPAEPVAGRTRLVKMVFLFEKEIHRPFKLDRVIPDEALPAFEAYHYGPFSADVYRDLEFLVRMGFVRVGATDGTEVLPEEADEYEHWRAGDGSDDDEPGDFPRAQVFSLSEIGRQFVDMGHAGELTAEQWDVLDRFKARCTATPLRTLLKYVYTKYPKYTSKSKIRDEVLR